MHGAQESAPSSSAAPGEGEGVESGWSAGLASPPTPTPRSLPSGESTAAALGAALPPPQEQQGSVPGCHQPFADGAG